MRRIALVLASFLLAGCGGGETTTVTRSVEATTTVRVTTTVAASTDATTESAPSEEVALDPEDVDGPLDIRDVTGRRRGELLTTTIVMYEPWETSLLGGVDVTEPGTERLTILYDVDFDGKAEFRGAMVFAGGDASLFIAGSGSAFEPIPVQRLDELTAVVTHPVDIFFLEDGETDLEAERDMQIAVTTSIDGERDRAPDTGWVRVPYAA